MTANTVVYRLCPAHNLNPPRVDGLAYGAGKSDAPAE